MSDNSRGILGDPEATGEQIRQAWEYAAVEAMNKRTVNLEDAYRQAA